MNIKLDSTGDIDFSSGNLSLIEGAEEIIQKIKIRFKFFLGEWYLDTRLGVPWFQQLLEKGVGDDVIGAKLQRVVLTTPGIRRIDEWTMTRNAATRALSVAFTAIISTGETITFNEVFIV